MIKILGDVKTSNYSARHEAFPYQLDAFEAIHELEYAAVFHEQGLGKTKIAIDVGLYWLAQREIDSILIITKKTLVKNWDDEIRIHTNLKPWILGANNKRNFVGLNSPVRFYVSHYEMVRSQQSMFEVFLNTRDVAVVLDEAQKIKNPDSALAQSFFNLAALFKRRIILTGTPVANRPYDLWALIYFLDNGKSLGDDFPGFKAEHDLRGELAHDPDLQAKLENNLETIFGNISSFSVRETKSGAGLDLPGKQIENIPCDWEPIQREIYDRYRLELRNSIFRDGQLQTDNAEEILKRLTRLLQVTSNPWVIDRSYAQVPGKFEVLRSIVDQIIDQREKVIIWSSYTSGVDWLVRELKEHGALRIHGKLAIEERNRSLDKFKTRDENKVLVATPGAAKEGLTLTVANHVIFYDRSFSLDDYLQAQDRIHRISQTRECYVKNLVLSGSIDEWVDRLLAAKNLAAALAQGDIDKEEFSTQFDFSFYDDLHEILGINEE